MSNSGPFLCVSAGTELNIISRNFHIGIVSMHSIQACPALMGAKSGEYNSRQDKDFPAPLSYLQPSNGK